VTFTFTFTDLITLAHGVEGFLKKTSIGRKTVFNHCKKYLNQLLWDWKRVEEYA
jgi:hypothetical protein